MSRKVYQQKYFQENKEKILARRKELRLKKRYGNQREIFSESAAQPGKVEQQTVSSCEEANELSISNVEELFPEEQVESGYAMVGGMEPAEFGAGSSRITREHTISTPRQISSIFSAVDRRSVDQVKVDSPNPAKVDQPVVDPGSVDQAMVDQKVVSADNQAAFLIGEGRRPLSHFFISAGILALLGANTFFLVAEQFSLYLAMGYGFKMAVMIAVLTEALLIAFSLLTSWTNNLLWKTALLTCCVLTCFVVVDVLESSVQHRGNVAARQSDRAERLKKNIARLEELEGTALAIIKKYDPDVYPTKIKTLMAELEASGPEGYSRRLREANARLDKISAAGSDHTEALLRQRQVAMLCNLLLSGYLGFLWRKKKENKVWKWLVKYFRMPVFA